ncbi:hypothetical protein ACLIBG_12335 [Virgibacillus sp. W0181]|uniref:hypothetical protein n=1 Tax=Virgibacillus sp. W0181 TaxID=3391581 RepID=UPI003F45F242
MSWIKTGHFSPLGITEEHIWYGLGFLSVCIIYLLVNALMLWLVANGLTKIITYIVSSLTTIVLSSLLIIYTDAFHASVIKIIMQSIAFFGLFVVILYLFFQLKRKLLSN